MNRQIKEISKQLENAGIDTDNIDRKHIKKIINFIKNLDVKDKNQLSTEKLQEIVENITNSMLNSNTQTKKCKKIGRNEKCPCNSGLKYKKCCETV